jgi:hypothetical protein
LERLSINATKLQLGLFPPLFYKKPIPYLRPGGCERMPIHLEQRLIHAISAFSDIYIEVAA